MFYRQRNFSMYYGYTGRYFYPMAVQNMEHSRSYYVRAFNNETQELCDKVEHLIKNDQFVLVRRKFHDNWETGGYYIPVITDCLGFFSNIPSDWMGEIGTKIDDFDTEFTEVIILSNRSDHDEQFKKASDEWEHRMRDLDGVADYYNYYEE